ncbi:MAG TPA: hypothetical protein VGV18_11625, partial [Verrucomicrobiae bacterium]|nr:hypothetical protein [Verrucomicrobiae bacterium]
MAAPPALTIYAVEMYPKFRTNQRDRVQELDGGPMTKSRLRQEAKAQIVNSQGCPAPAVSVTLPRMSNGAVPSQSPSKATTFFRRLITTVILWTVIIAALFFSSDLVSDSVFACIIVLLSAAGLMEFYGLAE